MNEAGSYIWVDCIMGNRRHFPAEAVIGNARRFGSFNLDLDSNFTGGVGSRPE